MIFMNLDFIDFFFFFTEDIDSYIKYIDFWFFLKRFLILKVLQVISSLRVPSWLVSKIQN